ncbi:hypothetical protein EG329_012009 [Mollisiaceae sp. DMI_Dod_QoI]|nr:hypothetical protein EG329_012009 [Helotiales sp. DMI_Dod_QoI]
MCITIINYDCHHRGEEHVLCRSYIQKLDRAAKANRNPSLWQQIFCVTRTPRCAQKPGKRRVFSKCPICMSRDTEERKRKDRETAIRAAFAREAHNKREAERLQERRRSQRKSAYRCSRCAAERRRPDQMSRAANGGLCCSRGLDEFAEMERASGYRPKISSRDAVADRPRKAPVPTREQRIPELRYMTSTEKARADAKAASNAYGWDRRQRDSEYLEPNLVAGYVNSVGADPKVFGTAPPPPPEPLYQELGIDIDLWRRMQHVELGTHGRIPPPPEKSLPIRPLVSRSSHKVQRKPVASQATPNRLTVDTTVSALTVSAYSSSRSRSSPVSPLSPKSKPKPRSNDNHPPLRSKVSQLNAGLYDAINHSLADWKNEPVPKFRYRY